VVSNETLYGDAVAVAIVVHEPLPAGARWKSTWSTPEPASAAEPLNVFAARR
jgi:hypothetical protein